MKRLVTCARVLAVLGALLAGCAERDANHTELHFWLMGREAEVIAELLPEFERRNPTIRVSVQQLPWTAAHEKLLTAFAGDALGVTPDHYNIYRAELNDADAEVANRDLSQLNLNANLHLLASAPDSSYGDKSFEFGKTYAYVVRSVIAVDGASLESSDSTAAIVEPRDTFPPAVPQALAAAVLPGETEGALLVDLSWSINVEPDFAGYRVYRSEQQHTKGHLLTPDLLPTPAYRDTSVQPAHNYWYAVTAVDRAGNESAPSPPVAVEIVQPSP